MESPTQQTPPPVILGPPDEIDAATRAFCATISSHPPVYVPVDPQPHGRVAYCFDNSVQQAEMHGGAAAYGWAIWRWPGRWFEAEHHAVWRRPDGSLLDVTPQLGDPKRILFLPDPEKVFDPERYRRNVMAPDADNPLAAEYIDLVRRRTDVTDKYWYPGVEVLPLFSPEDQARIAPLDARMAELRAAMRLDPSPSPAERFAAMARQPGHALNPAWRELTGEPVPGKRPRADEARYLLRLVRRRHPELEAQFDEARVRRAERHGAFPIWALAAAAIALVIAVAVLMASIDRQRRTMSSPPVPPSPIARGPGGDLTNQRVDTDRALETLYGDTLTINDIEDRNPALGEALRDVWSEAHKSGQGSGDFLFSVAAMIEARYRAAVRTAPDVVVREHYAIMRDGAEAQRSPSADSCAAFAEGGPYARELLPAALAERRQRLVVKVLLAPGAAPLAADPRLPPEVLQATAARADLALPTVIEALQGKGTAEDRCATHIALWETLLALPPAQGTALLRRL